MPTRAEQAEKTRQSVPRTARELFVRHGFDATSLQMIADNMGVTKANVYHYRTKIEILEALPADSVTALTTLLDQAEAVTKKRTEFVVRGFVAQAVAAHRDLAPMNRADPIIRRHPGISKQLDELAARGLKLLFGEHRHSTSRPRTPRSATSGWPCGNSPTCRTTSYAPSSLGCAREYWAYSESMSAFT